jgi:hypothetical protein
MASTGKGMEAASSRMASRIGSDRSMLVKSSQSKGWPRSHRKLSRYWATSDADSSAGVSLTKPNAGNQSQGRDDWCNQDRGPSTHVPLIVSRHHVALVRPSMAVDQDDIK